MEPVFDGRNMKLITIFCLNALFCVIAVATQPGENHD